MVDIYQYPVVKHINSGIVSSSTVSLPTNSLTYYLELTTYIPLNYFISSFSSIVDISVTEKLIISRNSFLLDVINSIINSFWDKNKAEKKWEKKK